MNSVMPCNKSIHLHSQVTVNCTRLLTEGGTPLWAMHRYAPASVLLTLDIANSRPLMEYPAKKKLSSVARASEKRGLSVIMVLIIT